MRHTISVYKYENGQYLFEIGGKGWGPGWFQYPQYVYVDQQQRLLVADTFNQRIQILKVNARETGEITKPKALTPGFQIKLTPEKGIK